MKRWSKLQKELYKLLDETIDFQLHCIAYPMHSQWGKSTLPRYYITLCKEIIWDYPKDFILCDGKVGDNNGESKIYPYETDVPNISCLIREYIDTPKDELFLKEFKNDHWGLTDILKSADKRIGKRRMPELRKKIKNKNAGKIIHSRGENGFTQ